MKTIPILAATTLSLFIATNVYHRIEQPFLNTEQKAETVVMPVSHRSADIHPASANWLATVQQDIALREYHIHYYQEEGYHQSPNRAHNTRVTYYPERLHITPRTTLEYAQPYDRQPEREREVIATYEEYSLDIAVEGYGTTTHNLYPFVADTVQSENNTALVNTPNMRVEYLNDERGTRQNFILQQPVQGNNAAVHLRITTTLSAKQEDEHSILFTGHEKNTRLYYSDLKVWDATGKQLPARMELSSIQTTGGESLHTYSLLLAVNTTGATYPITVDPIVANGTPANANRVLEVNQADGYFGFAVSSAGDVNADGYSDVIIAAHYYDNGQSDEGTAFVYHGSATGIGATAAAMIESNVVSALFGCDVSSAGDVNGDGFSDVIVGMRSYINGEFAEGGFRVFHGSASGISTTAATHVESNVTSASMGISVSGAGDVNGDGYSDVIVGADGFANVSVSGGAAFVYHGSASGISTTPAALLSLSANSVYFGTSVSNAGDVNGDGYSDVIVGDPEYSNGQASEGAAIVFHGSASGLNTTPAVILESNITSAAGCAVACAGDINGDGYSDVLSGAWYFENGQTEEGAVFVYYGSVTGVNPTVVRTIESNQAICQFGYSVAGAGDVNGDGYSDIIIGAYYFDNGQTDEGAAFVYHGSASGLSANHVSILESNRASSQFGISVACAGDVNGDGYSDIIIGDNIYSNGQSNEGHAFVYHGSASGINTTVSAMRESNQTGAQMGWSVASAGDVNGDGYNDVMVGARYFDNGQTDEGGVFIFHGSLSGIPVSITTTIESNQVEAYMGVSIGGAGDVNGDGYSDIIIGVHYFDNGQTDEGAAFVYHGSATGLANSAASILESNQVNALMGGAVSSAGDINSDGYSDIIVGAINFDNGQTDEGAAFIYHGSASGINNTAAAIVESNQANAYMGRSVACAGDINGDGHSDVVVGAFWYDNSQTDEGSAFVYQGSTAGINTIPSALLESNQTDANLGISVACAGDVNGDGYSDIIVGVYLYDNGQANEGAAFIYHGNSSGINATPSTIIEGNQNDCWFGWSVCGIGDVNGDGYSDIGIGAIRYDSGQADEGAAFIYHGSPSGVNLIAGVIVESNQAGSYKGSSISSCGDVNGDGYSDVIVGAIYYDNVQSEEGAAFIYYGNGGTSGRRNQVRLYNTDLTTPIQRSNGAAASFGAGLYASSPQGRQKVKMVWEVRQQGQAFSSAGGSITNSVSTTSVQTNFSNTGAGATHLSNLVSKPGLQSKVRCRVMYDLVTSVTGQKYGPWRYPQGYLNGQHSMGSTPVPVEWLSFTAQWLTPGERAQLHWSTASEKDNSHFTVLRSMDGQTWEEVTQLNGAGTTTNISTYTFTDNEIKHLNTSAHQHIYYRLMQTDYNGQFSFSEVRELTLKPQSVFSVSPNPGTHPVITLPAPAATDLSYTIVDIQGKEVGRGIISKGSMQQALSLQHLSTGVYVLSIERDGKKESIKLIRQ